MYIHHSLHKNGPSIQVCLLDNKVIDCTVRELIMLEKVLQTIKCANNLITKYVIKHLTKL